MNRSSITPETFVRHLLDEKNEFLFELSATPMDFRPPEGWLVEASGIPHHLFYFCKTGSLCAETSGHSFSLKAGDAIWIGPDRPFRFWSNEQSITSLARFRLHVRTSPSRRPALADGFVIAQDTQLTSIWLEAVRQECHLLAAHPSHSLRCAVAGLLSITFLPHPALVGRSSGKRKLRPAQIRILEEWAQSLPNDHHANTAEMARQLQFSRDYMNRLSRATFGISAERWLSRRRIASAAQRLAESALNVSQVADEYGYSSLYYFSRQFRQVMGCSPSEWRRSSRGG